MTLAFLILYSASLVVVGGFAVLWSGWPERHSGCLLRMKQKLPPMLRLWHPKHVIPFYVLSAVLLLLFEYAAYKALDGLAS